MFILLLACLKAMIGKEEDGGNGGMRLKSQNKRYEHEEG
jgi:hypothetical protein